jgi:hypothetical protein
MSFTASHDTTGLFIDTTTGGSAGGSVTFTDVITTPVRRFRDVFKGHKRETENDMKYEWNRFRAEFIRELLLEKPIGLKSYRMERSFDQSKRVPIVRVTLEYYPTRKDGARD